MLPSGAEFLLILLAVFILFGGKELRGFMRSLGQIVRKVQKAGQDFQRELNLPTLDEEDEKKKPDLKG